MNNASGRSKTSFWDFLRRLFGGLKPSDGMVTPSHPVVPPDNTTESARIITSRVLLVIYNPIMVAATGTTLIQTMHWNNPDDLSNTFIQDILETSGGLARYQVVQRTELNEFPALTDGYRYNPQTYLAVMNKTQSAHQPEYANYQAILTGLNVLPRIANREIDEVWLMGFPQAGFYESTMCGTGGFWCNSQPQTWSTGCNRRFVVMGFSSERGVGEMLHSFGHRTESILTQTFTQSAGTGTQRPGTGTQTQGNANLYAQFALYDKVAPGKAQIGNIHFPPNGERDYDYNNPRQVLSNCYDWYNFPAFKNDIRQVNADEWGNGDMRILHKWWLKHLPKVAGRTSGVANNWWQYIMDPNLVNM